MRPMFSYFGSKWMLARRYGPPAHDLVIEPFAGSAAYALYWGAPKSLLIDAFPEVVGIWQFLIKATEREIRALPLDFDHVDDLKIPQEAKWLIGYWIKKASVTAGKSRTAWARQYRHSGDCKVWGEAVRERIASQLPGIRGWKAQLRDWRDSPDMKATWLIDPPYQVAGKHYVFNEVDYGALAKFCRSRQGQVFVCENAGADWLPFRPFHKARGTFGYKRTGVSNEVVWSKDDDTRRVAVGAPAIPEVAQRLSTAVPGRRGVRPLA